MSRRMWTLALTLVALAVAGSLVARAGDDADAKMEAWMKSMTPGAPHRGLADQAGEWRYVVTMWEQPGAEPMALEGVALKRLIMGGRFLEEELSGEFMGRPFQGYGLTGYDNVTKQYQAVWIDNMGTGINFYTGREDRSGAHTYTSTVHDPATGRAIPTRSVGRVIDRDHHTFEAYMELPDGTDFLHMRVEYTRAGD